MKTKQPGFTLVELNLSIFFVAILILGVAMTTIQVSRMYQKGVTVKTVNQVGRDVFEQMRRDFASARSNTVNLDEVASGRVCLGSATYLFNNALVLNSAAAGIQDQAGNKVTLVRVADVNGEFCKREAGAFVLPNLTADRASEATELLTADDIPLAVHNFEAKAFIMSEESGLTETLYKLQLTLGTNQVDTTTGGKNAVCKPPTDNQANFDACFVSQFETVVRAGEISQ